MKDKFTDHSVITVANNNLKYIKFAINCAQSILLHNDISVFIVSNLEFQIPNKLKRHVTIVKANEQHAQLGIGIKLYIDKYLQTPKTLFIDSDCVCYDSLQPIFEACEEKNVSVAGTIVDSAIWVGAQQAATIEKEFGIKQLPRFNGGMYYLKKGEKTNQIFDFARSIIPNYDSFGFQRINNKWVNEEALIAISMVKFGETPIPDDGRYMTDLYTDPHPSKLNVLTRERALINPAMGQSRHRPWYPVGAYSPIILHFGGSNLNSYIYKSQVVLLNLRQKHLSTSLSTSLVKLFIHIPFRSLRWIIGLLRSLKTS